MTLELSIVVYFYQVVVIYSVLYFVTKGDRHEANFKCWVLYGNRGQEGKV